MRKIAIIGILLLYTLALRAHTPQISSIALVQNKENKWNLVISASLSAFQYEMMNTYPDQKLDGIPADQFQAMIVRHLKKKIKISANKKVALLQNGKVILGHQTDINFDVLGMPEQLSSLHLQQLGFGTLRDHYCILKLITKGKNSENFILQHGNNFAIALGIKDDIFTTAAKEGSKKWLIINSIVFSLLVVFAILYHNRHLFGQKANLANTAGTF